MNLQALLIEQNIRSTAFGLRIIDIVHYRPTIINEVNNTILTPSRCGVSETTGYNNKTIEIDHIAYIDTNLIFS